MEGLQAIKTETDLSWKGTQLSSQVISLNVDHNKDIGGQIICCVKEIKGIVSDSNNIF